MAYATLIHNGEAVIIRKDQPSFLFYHEVSDSDLSKGIDHVAKLCRSGAAPQVRVLTVDKATATLTALGMEVRLMRL